VGADKGEYIMHDSTLDTLTQRLARVERAMRWWKLLGLSAVAMLGLVVLLGAADRRNETVATEIRAKRVTLVDESGTIGASLHMDSFWGARLDLYADREGKIPSVSLYAGAAPPNFSGPGLPPYPGPELEIVAPHGKLTLAPESVHVRRMPVGHGASLSTHGLMIDTLDGSVLLNATPELFGLNLFSKDGNLQLSTVGGPALRLNDAEGKLRAVVGASQLETTRTGAVETRPASSLVLFDKNGKVLWSAP
jgi:hypothetical protein